MGLVGNGRASRIWKGVACEKIWASFRSDPYFFGYGDMGVREYGGKTLSKDFTPILRYPLTPIL